MASGDGLPEGIDLGRYHGFVIGDNDRQHLPKLRTAASDLLFGRTR